MSALSGTDTFSKSKWTWRSPSVDKSNLDNFHSNANAWSNSNMYRTSYNDMSEKVSKKTPLWVRAVIDHHLFRNPCL